METPDDMSVCIELLFFQYTIESKKSREIDWVYIRV